jgi:nucleoside-triphosphatase
MHKNLILAGKPASGKTTLIKEVCRRRLERLGGFYTEEIKEGNERQGFLLKTFDGKEGVLARKGMKSSCKLNKYGIDLGVLEGIGIAALGRALEEKDIIVIDEIGSMEIVSDHFRRQLLECLNSPKRILATIRFNAQPFTDEIKKMADTELVNLSRQNTFMVKKQVEEWMDR